MVEVAGDGGVGEESDEELVMLQPHPGCVSVSSMDYGLYYNYTFLPSQNVTTCYLPIAGDLEGI